MTPATALADEYFAHRQTAEPNRLLYFGQVHGLENWEDVAPGAIAERQVALEDYAQRAEQLRGDASPDDRVLLDTVAFTARATALGLTWRTEQNLVNPVFGLHATLTTFLGRFSLITEEHGAAYITKLERLPALLASIGHEVESSAASGNVALARHLEAAASAIEASMPGGDGQPDPLSVQAAPTELSDDAAAAWRGRVEQIVADEVRPALAAYAQVLRRVSALGRPDDQAGFCHLDGGLEHYQRLVWANTSLDLTPEQIHQIGLEQIERLEREYVALAGPLLGTDDLQEIYARLRDDPDLHYASGDDIVRDATAALERAAAAAPDWFSSIPASECFANETEGGPLAFYSPPDPPTGKPGRFFFNTSVPAAWATYELEAVTFHESIPGHHLQIAGFRESDSLHPVQIQFGITAYLEGWGLYTERLADEMGLYSSELARIGMLSTDSMRACRLVVDTGMHALGWSRQQAIDYFSAHSPMSSTLISGEIDRYIGMPGQALSYMIGRIEIDRIRAEAQTRPDFDISAFHDQLLAYGMVPLPTLRELVLA